MQIRLSLQSHNSPVAVTQKLNVYAIRIAIVFHCLDRKGKSCFFLLLRVLIIIGWMRDFKVYSCR